LLRNSITYKFSLLSERVRQKLLSANYFRLYLKYPWLYRSDFFGTRCGQLQRRISKKSL